MYNPNSDIATEFIGHDEILDTIEYARLKASDVPYVDSLIRKSLEYKGLTHREAAVLLECDDSDTVKRIFKAANEIKQRFYGNRIVMFAPSISPTTVSTDVSTVPIISRTRLSRAASCRRTRYAAR